MIAGWSTSVRVERIGGRGHLLEQHLVIPCCFLAVAYEQLCHCTYELLLNFELFSLLDERECKLLEQFLYAREHAGIAPPIRSADIPAMRGENDFCEGKVHFLEVLN